MVATHSMIAASAFAASFDVDRHWNTFHAGAGMVRRGDAVSWNAARGVTPHQALRSHREIFNANQLAAAWQRHLAMHGRTDAFDPQAAFYLAGELEHTLTGVLEEPRPLETALELFNLDSTIAVGATTFRAAREFAAGQARVHSRGGGRVNRVSVQTQTEDWPIHHLTAGHGWDFFESLSDGFAGRNRIASLQRANRNAIDTLANKIWWGLDNEGEPYGLYGVINHPFLNTVDMAVGGSRASLTADPDGSLQALHQLIDFPRATYRGVYSPDKVAMPGRLRLHLAETEMGDGRDKLLLQRFWEANPHLSSESDIVTADELQDAGGPGIDGIFCYNSAPGRGISLPMPQGTTMLPAFQVDSLNWEVVMYMSLGGAWMPEPRNQVMGFIDINA